MKLGLQIALGILSLIPLTFAVLGVMQGASYFMPEGGYPASIDNQLRYLSAIYLLVSMLLWYAIPNVEKHGKLLGFICLAIFLGGLSRLLSHTTIGPGMTTQFGGMILELGSPLLYVWQRMLARKTGDA